MEKQTKKQVLDLLPQKPPFRFVDEILAVNQDVITGAYRFKEEEFFFEGHFPGNPVTPGVILLEAMAQAGLTAHLVWRLLERGQAPEAIRKMVTLFTLADQVEFTNIVRPGDRVIIQGENQFFRKNSARARVAVTLENGKPVATGVITGTGVKTNGA